MTEISASCISEGEFEAKYLRVAVVRLFPVVISSVTVFVVFIGFFERNRLCGVSHHSFVPGFVDEEAQQVTYLGPTCSPKR